MSEVLARLEPSLGRRWIGVICLAALGLCLLYFAVFEATGHLGYSLLLIVAGLGCLWQAQWNLRVTQTGLYLTRQGLFDAKDDLICPLYNMQEVERGIFAFKPSNGFLVRLSEPEPRAWAPGLYWRLGRRLGIGGATQPAQAKAMADTIDLLIRERSMGTRG